MTAALPRLLPALRSRASPYSYRCNACSRCCHGRGIRVTPYELARLAQNRGMGTTELLARFTREEGTILARGPDGACVFLTGAGCGVHPDRPLACRLYPLGRVVGADGGEAFVELEPHPGSEGVTGAAGTVGEYLEAQGAGPYLDAARRYHLRYLRMARLASRGVEGDAGAESGLETGSETATEPSPPAPPLLDVDRAVGEHCRAAGVAPPPTVEGRVSLHLRLLDRWLDAVERPAPR